MQKNLLWTGIEYYSFENCLIKEQSAGFTIDSTIVGRYEEKLYRVEYKIITNTLWETLSMTVICRYNNKNLHHSFHRDASSNWWANGQPVEQFHGCIDVDIRVTPFTNTLPIRRLKLNRGESRELRVIYFDLLNDTVSPVSQRYTKVSDTVYHYENIPNDFEADIHVDEFGLVVSYPSLFERNAILDASYPE
jgi:hypothetical protein